MITFSSMDFLIDILQIWGTGATANWIMVFLGTGLMLSVFWFSVSTYGRVKYRLGLVEGRQIGTEAKLDAHIQDTSKVEELIMEVKRDMDLILKRL
jgi:hypothetical protein